MWELLVVSVFGSSAQCLNLRFNQFLWQSAPPGGTRWLFRVMAKFGECNNTPRHLHIVGSKVCISRFEQKVSAPGWMSIKRVCREAVRTPESERSGALICTLEFVVVVFQSRSPAGRESHQLHRLG